MTTFKTSLEKALLEIDDSDENQRRVIYKRALVSLATAEEKLSSDQFEELQAKIVGTIREIETKYVENPDRRVSGAIEKKPVQVSPSVDVGKVQASNENTRIIAPTKKSTFPFIWIGVLAVIIAAAVYYFFVFAASPLSSGAWRLEMDDWKSTFSSQVDGSVPVGKPVENYRTQKLGENTVLAVRGLASFYTNEMVWVDTNNVHTLSIRMRVVGTGNEPVLGKTLVGLATFDGLKNLQTSNPGAHRYGTLVREVSSTEGWKTYTGRFTGVGDKNFLQLREGTAFVKPVVLVNYGNRQDVVTEIDWIELKVEAPEPTDN